MRSAITLAERRQAERMAKGKPTAKVTLTLAEAMSLLHEQNYRCALTRLMFYSLSGGSYSPSRPSLDRIKHAGPYSLGNVRVIMLGVNGLRGKGTDTMANALAANGPTQQLIRPA
jgi:hypothetical protein